jgi:hypothetical protein
MWLVREATLKIEVAVGAHECRWKPPILVQASVCYVEVCTNKDARLARSGRTARFNVVKAEPQSATRRLHERPRTTQKQYHVI